MPHVVVLLGAGYAGLPAAQRLARQVRPEDVEVVVVSLSDRFVERPRLHQRATGQQLKDIALGQYLAGTGARLQVGRVTSLDTARHELTLERADGVGYLRYDTLVYALGSTTDTDAVPGVAEHAHSWGGPEVAQRIRRRLESLTERGGAVVVCGGGLTGIETAAEVAEAFPTLDIRLVTAGNPGAWLSPRGRAYVATTLQALGVSVTADVRIRQVHPDRLQLSTGADIGFDLCIWAGGFTAPGLARDSGLKVDGVGRILTDRHLRSVSDPDVWALGDAAAVPGPWGEALAMGCRTGGFTGPTGADNVAASLTGGRLRSFRYRYVHECVSLGRRRGLVQFLRRDETPTTAVLTGRPALLYKEATLRSAVLLFRWPGPYLPHRRRRRPGRTGR